MQYSHPWPHFVIDNFLTRENLQRLQDSLTQSTNKFRQDEDDDMKINYMFLPDIELAKYFLSSNFRKFLEETTGHFLELNTNSLVQLRKMTPASPAMPPHVDSQDEKSLVCILYISPDWKKSYGGELCLLTHSDQNPRAAHSKIIEPLSNRLILFLSEDTHWHCVNSVKNWDRYSVMMEWHIQTEVK